MKAPIQQLIALSMGAMFKDDTTGASGSGNSGKGVTMPDTAQEVPIPEGMRGQIFHFRKEKVRDEEGKELGETKKHPSVTIPLPVPTRELVLAIFNAPVEGEGNRASEQKYVLDLISDALYGQAREQINEFRETNPDAIVSANIIDYDKLSVTALANMPASERGNKISDEDMKAFIADYVAVMPEAASKDAKKIAAQASLLEKGLRPVKTDKKVLGVMNDMLTVWAASTQSLEEHQTVYDWFVNKIKKWTTAEPKNVLESIL